MNAALRDRADGWAEDVAEVFTTIDAWVREHPDASPQEAAREVTRRLLQKQIHADGREKPYLSGRLAKLVGVPATSCPWVEGTWQQKAFSAGYAKEVAAEFIGKRIEDEEHGRGTIVDTSEQNVTVALDSGNLLVVSKSALEAVPAETTPAERSEANA